MNRGAHASPPRLPGRLRRFAAALSGFRTVVRRFAGRRDRHPLQPVNPPIERIAADLRRLLWNHDSVAWSADVARSSWHLRALESAITICATQAARALDVPYPDPPAHGHFDQPQLRRLLRALAAEGLVLLPGAGLLAPDRRR